MLVASGAVLVLITWVVCIVAAIGVGSLPSLVASSGAWRASSLRVALWWGVLILTVLIALTSLGLPLRSAAAAWVVVAAAALLTGVGLWWRIRTGARPLSLNVGLWTGLLLVALSAGVAYLAISALGPVTNYDSGLYHLGAIAYAGDHPAIRGLANLYFPLGYANVEFPLAAFLGNGPWEGGGYRLLNGLLLAMASFDLAHRALRRRKGAGFFVLTVGMAATLVPMVALSDYWVTSPTSDSAVLVLTIVAVAYLADAVASVRDWWGNSSAAAALAIVAVMLRPTMVPFALVTFAVLVAAGMNKRSNLPLRIGPVALVAFAAALAGAAVLARDYVLSGWVQFPLSVHAFDVPWLAPDPTGSRTATLGAARDPDNLWSAAQGWDWIGPWSRRLPSQWEVYAFGALILATVLVLVAARRLGPPLRIRGMVATMAPSVVSVAVWWVATPPSFRFIWGPLFTSAGIPLGWLLWRLHQGTSSRSRQSFWLNATIAGIAVPVLLVVAYSGTARLDVAGMSEKHHWGLGIPYVVAPIVDAPVRDVELSTGLVVKQPTQSDQCWAVYPLCTPQLLSDIRLSGDGIGAGFEQAD